MWSHFKMGLMFENKKTGLGKKKKKLICNLYTAHHTTSWYKSKYHLISGND